ncbi:hypothetical protein IscW_ISCW014769, partial [Ixodes scapularis]
CKRMAAVHRQRRNRNQVHHQNIFGRTAQATTTLQISSHGEFHLLHYDIVKCGTTEAPGSPGRQRIG